jgi:hypothetical protein
MWLTLVTEKRSSSKNPFDFSSQSSSHVHKEEEQPNTSSPTFPKCDEAEVYTNGQHKTKSITLPQNSKKQPCNMCVDYQCVTYCYISTCLDEWKPFYLVVLMNEDLITSYLTLLKIKCEWLYFTSTKNGGNVWYIREETYKFHVLRFWVRVWYFYLNRS